MLTPAGFAHRASNGRWVCPPHLALLNRKLTALAAGRIRRLLVCLPPRHGKSELISKYFPAWYLGTFPDRRVILASYESDFAAGWGRKVRDLLNEHGKGIFGVRVRQDSSAADRWDLEGETGGMTTAGVGASVTGRGAHLLVIDDPVKNAEEANSPTYRNRAWDWYVSTAYTRLEPGGAVALVQTRWHEDDLAGRILASAGRTGEPWEVLNLPALAEEGDPLGRQPGEALWPARYSAERLLEIRATQDDPAAGQVRHWFDALYQQRPVPAEGGLFKRDWFRYWAPGGSGGRYRLEQPGGGTKVVLASDCRRFGVVDLAFSTKTSADYTVITAWAVTPDSDLVLLDVVRARMEGPEIIPAVAGVYRDHDLAYVGIEEVAAQMLVVQQARRQGLVVRGLKADKDKRTRAIPATIRMEAGQVYLPKFHPLRADVEAELLAFDSGAHDDVVDNFAYAAVEVQKRGGPGLSAADRARQAEAAQAARWAADQARLNPMNDALF